MCCFLFQNYTQYIPLSIYDLQTWMGSPSIFVYDCSNAGLIVKSFKQFALQREQELEVRHFYWRPGWELGVRVRPSVVLSSQVRWALLWCSEC